MKSVRASSGRLTPGLIALLIVPFIGTLCVPFYNRVDPELAGIPFFYWYQFLWIPIGAAITAYAYLVTRKKS
ncbi:MAG: DUF3311 domain-containing protein [Polyangiaceae bacterium]